MFHKITRAYDLTTDVDINNLPLDDKLAYQLLSRGDAAGVSQFESSGIKDFLVTMKPDCIEDVVALSASYRYRAMKVLLNVNC
jgi:DNA polymerase-3 subunit alpha